MKTKKSISLLLVLTLLATSVLTVSVLPAAAASNAAVRFLSPAIPVNVGDTVDFSQYGVEFTENTVTAAEDITWTKSETAKTVSYRTPAVFADVGETIDLTKYTVEFTEDTATAAESIEWSNEAAVATVTYRTPAIFANVGDTIDLTQYAVEFTEDTATAPDEIAWSDSEGAVTAVTPDAVGVTTLTASAGENSKNVYVVTKNATDTEYVLYLNDFNEAEDINDISAASYNSATASVNAEEGRLEIDGSSWNIGSFLMPAWLADFGDYRLEMSSSISALGSQGVAAWQGMRARVSEDLCEGYNAVIRRDADAAAYSSWIVQWDASCKEAALLSKAGKYPSDLSYDGTVFYTHVMDVQDDTIAYTVNGTAVETATNATALRLGRPGLMVNCLSLYVDYFKVTVTPPAGAASNLTTYTPTAAGVTPLKATAGENEKTVYVVAKNATDTEYVLYENDFNDASDINDITAASYNTATAAVADGNLKISATSGWKTGSFLMPAWLGEFGDYRIETYATLPEQSANMAGSFWVGLRARVSEDLCEGYNAAIRQNADAAAYSSWIAYWNAEMAATNLSMAGKFTSDLDLGTYYTFAMDVQDDTIKFTINNVAVETATDATALRIGRPGVVVNCGSMNLDYFKVTVAPQEVSAEVTTFTATEKGVTAFTATDKDGNQKTVYVVAKEAEETEWVLYENTFDSAADLNDITATDVSANVTMAVEDGKFVLDAYTNDSWGTAFVTLPAWLGDFGNYAMETVSTITAQRAVSCWQGMLFRAQDQDAGAPYYVASMKNNGNDWDGVALSLRPDSSWTFNNILYGKCSSYSLNTAYTHKLMVRDDIMEYTLGGTTVMYHAKPKELRTGLLGYATIGSVAYIDSFKVTLMPDLTLPNAPASATYERTTDILGMADGTVTVNLDTTGGEVADVVCYWGDGEGKLDGYAAHMKQRVTGGKTSITFDLAANTFIPEGATELRIYTNNPLGESETCVSVKLPVSIGRLNTDDMLYSFQVISDTHINGDASHDNSAHLQKFLQDVVVNDPDSKGIFIGGDVVNNGSADEYALFEEIWSSVDGVPPLYAVIGNHEFWTEDYDGTMANFKQSITNLGGKTATDKHYFSETITVGEETYEYLFLAPMDEGGVDNPTVVTIDDEQMAWLDEKLAAADTDKPIFIFLHQPMYNTVAGTVDGQPNAGVSNHEALKATLADYPQAILFTSHSHWTLNAAKNMYKADGTLCNVFNTAATSYINDGYYAAGGVSDTGAQGYYVEVYADKVLVRGKDLVTDEWLPSSQFVVYYSEPENWPANVPTLFASAPTEKETFSFSAAGLSPYSGGYTANGGQGWYSFPATDTAVVNGITGKFDLYYNREDQYFARDLFTSGDTGGETSRWLLLYNHWLQRTESLGWGEKMRKIDSLVPLNSFGEEAVVKNFETTYDIRFENEEYGGVVLGFRQNMPGKFTNNYWNINKEQGFVLIGRDGITIAAGNGIVSERDNAGDMYNAWQTKTFDTILPQEVSVKVRVVNDTCTVEIYQFGTTTLIESFEETVNYDKAGYIAYGIATVCHDIGNIKLTALDENGNVTDLGTPASTDPAVLEYNGGRIYTMGEETANGTYKYTLQIAPRADYELKAGSLVVTDTNGTQIVPTRVGYREGGTAEYYAFESAVGGTVSAEFYQPTKEDPNIGWVGTSVHEEDSGLRFIHRLNIDADGYMTMDGEKVKISEYGLLLASGAILSNPEDLDIETANESAHVHQFAWPETDKYYDLCSDYADIAIHVKNIAAYNGQNTDLITRVYLVLESGEVIYGDVAVSSYNKAAGLA